MPSGGNRNPANAPRSTADGNGTGASGESREPSAIAQCNSAGSGLAVPVWDRVADEGRASGGESIEGRRVKADTDTYDFDGARDARNSAQGLRWFFDRDPPLRAVGLARVGL